MKGRIHSIETFGTVDGFGIRYVIFLQGCNFRCAYCHNPDTWNENIGRKLETKDIIDDAVRYKRYISGITVTGGEPLLQPQFVRELFSLAKENGLTTCLDTSGGVFDLNDNEKMDIINDILDLCDLVMLDIKHINCEEHRKLTGDGNEKVLDMARHLASRNDRVWLRYVLVPSINDSEEDLTKWKEFADSLGNVEKIELLPYHTMGVHKYKELGIPYRLEGVKTPSIQEVDRAKKILGLGEKKHD